MDISLGYRISETDPDGQKESFTQYVLERHWAVQRER